MRVRRFATAAGVAFAIALLSAGAVAGRPETHLSRIYKGDDGSYLYLRQIGGATGTVYGLGEHPGRNRAYVLKATLSGDTLDGAWWAVPKGAKPRFDKGELTLRAAPGGSKLTRTAGTPLGAGTWTAIGATGIAWAPPRLAAEFQSISGNDLTGAYDGDDKSRHYVRETSFNVVWVAEKGFQPGERPGWVSVFTGKRQANGRVSGKWVDVPKGIELRDGTFDALQAPGTRKLLLGGDSRTKGLEPDYAVDFKKFGEGIEKEFKDKVSGFGYAIAKDGAIAWKGAGGYRLWYLSGPKEGEPFTPETMNGVDSTTKLMTAAAVMKALAEKGLTVDTKVAKYLPSCWAKGPGVKDMTFRSFLGHTSLVYEVSPSCNKDPYGCLAAAIKNGRQPERDAKKDGYDYENINYALLRPVLASVVTDRKIDADFKLYKCKNPSDKLNQRFSAVFASYFYGMLKSIGVKARYAPISDENRAYRYKFGEERSLGGEVSEGPTKYALLRSAGAGGLWTSAVDYVRFLSALDRGELVSPASLYVMKAGRLGFERSCTLDGALGPCYWKNGGLEVSKKRGSESIAIILADGVQVFLTINSAYNAYTGYRGSRVLDAYHAALK